MSTARAGDKFVWLINARENNKKVPRSSRVCCVCQIFALAYYLMSVGNSPASKHKQGFVCGLQLQPKSPLCKRIENVLSPKMASIDFDEGAFYWLLSEENILSSIFNATVYFHLICTS